MRILVTGATGYIGAHICAALHSKHYLVDGLDISMDHNNISGYCQNIIKGDVTTCDRLGKYDAVVHLAGLIQVEESVLSPSKYYHTNLGGTMKVLQHYPDSHIIFASTAGAFDPLSPYARSKIAAEDVIKEKSSQYTILRFFNVAGSDGSNMQVGKATHLIRVAAECAAGKRSKMSIFGDNYDTRDGTCVRDYIHVVDLANTIVSVIEDGAQNTPYECIGSGSGYTTREVVNTMKQVTGIDFSVDIGDRRAGDPASLSIEGKFKHLKIEHTLADMCRSAYEVEMKR